MTKVLVDFSQAVISACAVQANELKSQDNIKDLVKHIALNMILSWKKKFNGKMILACDSKYYWRKQEFPYYKGHRKHKRKDDGFLPWETIFETINELKQELKENFPYTLLEVDGAEADDIIAVLCKYFQENELIQTGLIEEPEDIVIISTDGDFGQLQKYSNVRQWNNVQKKFIKCTNAKAFLNEHIMLGDSGDNVPSVTTGTKWAEDRANNISVRATPLKSSRHTDFINNGIEACISEDERKNWLRNQMLVDFSKIPDDINNKIIAEYEDYIKQGGKAKIFNYLTRHKMKLLLGSVEDF